MTFYEFWLSINEAIAEILGIDDINEFIEPDEEYGNDEFYDSDEEINLKNKTS